MSFFQVLWIFFLCSVLGWAAEIAAEAVRHRRYVDKSLLFGPLCPVYGITAVLLAAGLQELRGNYAFLFLGSAITATVVEWIAGHLLEWATGTRWWDYSKLRWDLDGYICLYASALWGLLGLVSVEWGIPLLLELYDWLPGLPVRIVLCVLLGVLTADLIATSLALSGLRDRLPRVETVGARLAVLTLRLGLWIFRRCDAHIQRAHPAAVLGRRRERAKVSPFARGTSFYSIVLLFAVGSLCGDLVETIFCWVRMGEWMSRSSLVWGPFSVVWGMALAGGTLLMYRHRHASASFFFVAGTLLGGLYEYLCSVCSEAILGTVFWDYSEIPFNLGGRINLLYCFFWGFAAVAWFRGLYPPLARWIARIPERAGKWCVRALAVFLAVDMVVSGLALLRYSARHAGDPADAAWEVWIDSRFDDGRMAQIYPKAVFTE